MKIEFENLDSKFQIDEHIIRPVEIDIDGEEVSKRSHFQARLFMNGFDCDGNIGCVISYYDSENKFLGLNQDSIWTHDTKEGDPIPISMAIDIPDDAARAVFRFNYSDNSGGFYYWAGRIATFMGLMLLSSFLLRSFNVFQ